MRKKIVKDPRGKVTLRPTARAKWATIAEYRGWNYTEAAERMADREMALIEQEKARNAIAGTDALSPNAQSTAPATGHKAKS